MNLRDRIEKGFESWTRWILRRRWLVIGVALPLAVAMASGVSRIEVDLAFEEFLHPDDPARVAYDEYREVFGREDAVVVAIRSAEIFSLGFLEKLRAFHRDIEREVPQLDEITSLINARNTRGEGDELIVEDLLEEWPADGAALAALRERVLSNPLYVNNLISRDASFTTVMLELETYSSEDGQGDELSFDEEEAPAEPEFMTGAEDFAVVEALYEIASRYEAPDFRLFVAGQPVVLNDVASAMMRDTPRFAALAIFTIAVLLFALFRRPVAVVLPLLVVALSVASTVGLMGWTGASIHVPTQILPTFLLAVGVGASVHLLTIFFQRLGRGASREDALAGALGHSGLPIVLTSLTTAGGLVSFSVVQLAPIAALGVFAPVGVMLALVYTLTLLPALLAVVPMRGARPAASGERPGPILRMLTFFGDTGTGRPWTVIGISAVLCIAAAAGAARLRFSHNPLEWLPPEAPVRVATLEIDRELGGAMALELVLDSGRTDGLYQPELLRRMEALGRSFEERPHAGVRAGQTISIVDIVKEIHQALNEDRPEFHRVPDDRLLIAQELLLFENSGSDDLGKMVDSQFQTGRFTLRAPWKDAIAYVPFFELAQKFARDTVGELAEISFTGALPFMTRTLENAIHGMARSYVLALLIITPLMVLLLGNLRIGLLSMVPNLAPILLALGLMGWLGLTLDLFGLLVGGIAIGLAVDDTIHFMHNFRRYHDHGRDVHAAVRETLHTAGHAMLVTTLVLTLGFLSFALSSMRNLTFFGLLVGFALGVAFLADVLLAPALVRVATRRRGGDR
jgi:predicted RND superfamily exporter protein